MTPIELDNYIKCLANLEVGDEVEVSSCIYVGKPATGIVIAIDRNKVPLYMIHNLASPKQTSQVGLIVLAVKDRSRPASRGVGIGDMDHTSRKLIDESAKQKYSQFKTLNGIIHIHKVFKCAQHSK